jgi:hypothetical protein
MIHNTDPGWNRLANYVPEDETNHQSNFWFGHGSLLWLAKQSHGQFCSSRIQTLTKGFCFICCEADYHLISGYKKNFQPLKVPPRLCLERYNKLLRRKSTSHHHLSVNLKNNFTNFQNSPCARGPKWPGPNWTTAELSCCERGGKSFAGAPRPKITAQRTRTVCRL